MPLRAFRVTESKFITTPFQSGCIYTNLLHLRLIKKATRKLSKVKFIHRFFRIPIEVGNLKKIIRNLTNRFHFCGICILFIEVSQTTFLCSSFFENKVEIKPTHVDV